MGDWGRFGAVGAALAHFEDKYRVVARIKDGGGVETLLAESTLDGSAAVVKRAETSQISAALGLRLEHEADVLARLCNPAGEPYLLDHGRADGWMWFAQRYQPGETLATRLERSSLGCDETLVVARSVLTQLGLAHTSGIVHRDIKPANIVVDGPGAIQGATLVDFGLSRSLWLDPSIRDVAVGTARYCSPEQAGLIDHPIDGRSDLYSLGATLYECLAGAPLFPGERIAEVLRQKLAGTLTPVSRRGHGVPRALSEVIERLLRKDPDERYQTAEAALADIEEIQRARRAGIADPPVVVGRHDRRGTLAEPGFVGRATELAALEALLEEGRAGRGSLVMLEAESGEGKSRLLEELARRASDAGVTVVSGQATDRAAQPRRVFEGVAADLVAAALDDPALAGRVRERLGAMAGTAVAVAPRLASILPGVDADPLPEDYAHTRSVAVLAGILDAVGADESPALVLLDDVQWSQALTAEILQRWVGGAKSKCWTMVVAAYRSEEVDDHSPLRSVEPCGRMTLAPFDERDVKKLLASMAGPLPEDVESEVVRLSQGNAFMAQATLRGMVESSALARSGDAWTVDDAGLKTVQTSRQAALFLARRLDLLSADAQDLLKGAAVLGKDFELDLAVSLSALAPSNVVPTLDELQHRRILWLGESGRRARFIHDKLREASLARLTHDERTDLHLRAALQIGAGPDPNPFDLAYHFDAAGRFAEALEPALAAAEISRSQHALDSAELYYRIAAKGAGERATKALVADGLGEVLSLAGHYADAAESFAQAAQLVDDDLSRAVLEGKLGEVSFRQGDQVLASPRLETALRGIGRRVPKSALGFLIGAAWELVVQAGHTAAPGLVRWRRRTATDTDRLAMRFYSKLAYSYWFRSGRVPCLWAHLRGMNLAERFGPSPALAQAYSEHAPAMTMIPWYSRGISYALRSLEMRRDLGDVWGQGQSLNFYGVVLYAASRFRKCIAACEEAAQILSLTGDHWEMNTARWHVAAAHYRLGELREAKEAAESLYPYAERIGDSSSSGLALSAWSRATDGLVPAEALARAESRKLDDRHTAAEVSLARAIYLLRRDQAASAAELLAGAWRDVAEAGLRQEYVLALLPWWATALRRSSDALPGGDPAWPSLHKRNRQVARRATRLGRSYRNNLPHALRELALVEARSGRPKRARRLLTRSIEEAAAQGARWEEAKSRRELGTLGVALGWPAAREALQVAGEALAAIETGAVNETVEASPTLSLADRFAQLLEAGRTVAAATTTGAIYDAIQVAALSLLRAESCHVLQIGGEADHDLATISGHPLEGISATAVKEATRTGRVVCLEPSATDVTDSLVLAGVRSLLCAPIHSDGRVVACFYATHREVAGLFGDEERQVASFISALAGAALDQVSGSARRFRALVEQSHDVTLLTDANAVAHYASPALTRVLGWETDEMVGETGATKVHPEDLECAAAAFGAAVARPGSTQRAECRVLHKDGSWRWIEVAHTNRLDDPAVNSMVVNIHDITERVQAEHSSAKAAEQFRLAFDEAPIGVALVSQRHGSPNRFLRVNDALAEMLGYERRELEGKTTEELSHPDDRDGDLLAGEGFQRGETDVSRTEKRYLHRDGHWVWVNSHSGLVRDDNGEPDYVVTQIVDVTEKRAASERLEREARHDPLTGLPNRRHFREALDRALARSKRHGGNVAVLYLDLDRFKVINDSHGHPMGDQVLVETGRRLLELTRASDTLARLGGDEFVLLVEDLDEPEEVKTIALRIEEALRQPITVTPGVDVSVTTSIGITVAGPDAGSDELMRDADIALYRAKDLGKDRYEVFGEHLRELALGRERTERDLRSAIDESRMVLHYQPILDLATGAPVAVESLVRYRSASGLVHPGTFIDVAEETGLIVELGTWVLRQACLDLRVLAHSSANPTLRIGVNVSPRQIVSAGFVDSVARVVDEAGVAPSSVALEITEVALIEMAEPIRPGLERLRDLGCQIGIDDFGTGYSSLRYLRRLPLDFVKIDRSFVSGLGTSSEDEAIVRAVIGLADALGLVTIAEGVETPQQHEVLASFGCTLAQGYMYGRPAPPEDVFGGAAQHRGSRRGFANLATSPSGVAQLAEHATVNRVVVGPSPTPGAPAAVQE